MYIETWDIAKEFRPLKTQYMTWYSPTPFNAYIGGFGSGKSRLGCYRALDSLVRYPGNIGVIARKNLSDLKTSTYKTFIAICPKWMIAEENRSESWIMLWNGSIVYFRGCNDPEKFKSMELGFFYVDEASELDTSEAFDILAGRLRLKTVPPDAYWGLLGSNPGDEDHWIYPMFRDVETKSGECSYFNAPTYENRDNLPDGYIERLEEHYTQDWIDVFLKGQPGLILNGKPVYKEFKAEKHVKTVTPLDGSPILRGWDFGYHHPCVVFAQEVNGKLMILHEICGKDELIDDFGKMVLVESEQLYPGFDFVDYGDPAGRQMNDKNDRTSVQILSTMGVYVRTNVDRSIKNGILLLRILLKNNLYVVDKQCKTVIDGLRGGYKYPDKIQPDGNKNPEKDNRYDHPQDCIRYIATQLPSLKHWLKMPIRPTENPNSFNAVRRRYIGNNG